MPGCQSARGALSLRLSSGCQAPVQPSSAASLSFRTRPQGSDAIAGMLPGWRGTPVEPFGDRRQGEWGGNPGTGDPQKSRTYRQAALRGLMSCVPRAYIGHFQLRSMSSAGRAAERRDERSQVITLAGLRLLL